MQVTRKQQKNIRLVDCVFCYDTILGGLKDSLHKEEAVHVLFKPFRDQFRPSCLRLEAEYCGTIQWIDIAPGKVETANHPDITTASVCGRN